MTLVRRMAVSATILAMLAGCGPTAKEKKVIDELTSNMKTVCVGRFMMDVPQNVKVNGNVKLFYGLGRDSNTVDVSIESADSSVAAMRAAMDAEAQKIDKDDKNWETKKSMLLDYRVVDDHTIYLRQQDSLESAAGSKHELHLLVGKTRLLLTATSYEGLDAADRMEPDEKVETPEQVTTRLFQIAHGIRAIDTSDKVGPGYCLGPVVIDSNQDEEQGSTYMSLDRNPDFEVTVYNKGLTPDQPDDLLSGRAKAAAGYPQIHEFRNRDITMGGMKAHEWLAQITDHDHDDIAMLIFAAESMRPNPALVRPYMNITLETGGQLVRGPKSDLGKYVNSSLAPKEAMGLWDAMIPSIRPRPDAVRSASSKTTP